jgi:nicotinate-nucleotide adenylyltransferase
MLALATANEPKVTISRAELDLPEKPYTVETLRRLQEMFRDTRIFFVMGADSWMDIRTWRKWETVLAMVDHIVVTRPGYEIGFDHVTPEIRERIIDTRSKSPGTLDLGPGTRDSRLTTRDSGIYITDAVELDISASAVRNNIRADAPGWRNDLPDEVAKYIEKYQIYK